MTNWPRGWWRRKGREESPRGPPATPNGQNPAPQPRGRSGGRAALLVAKAVRGERYGCGIRRRRKGVLSLTSIATLIVAWRILRTVRRSGQAGDERLEMLREQPQRLAYLNEVRSALLDTLELLRRQMDETERRLELPPAPPEAASQRAAGEPEDPDGAGPRSGNGGAQEGAQPRSS